jgi:hypothetical protein
MKIKKAIRSGKSTNRSNKSVKQKTATLKAPESRIVTKIVGSVSDNKRRAPKRNDKMKKYSLKALNEYFEGKFNLSLSSEHAIKLAQMKFRNKYLFPALKEDGKIYKKSDIIFDEGDALNYLQLVSRTLDKSDVYYMEEVPFMEFNKKTFNSNVNKDDKIVIKKSSLSTASEA